MLRIGMTILAVTVVGSLVGCKAYDKYPDPPAMKMKTLYKNDDSGFHSVPGTELGERQLRNVRAGERVKTYYSGRYSDPNSPDIMYQQGEFYRVEDSPQWNLRPNPSLKPYQRDAAYMHIQNIANATPLAAETELKYKQAGSLGTALRYQADQVKKAAETIKQQKVEVAKYNENMQKLINDNRELKAQLLKMQHQGNFSHEAKNSDIGTDNFDDFDLDSEQ